MKREIIKLVAYSHNAFDIRIFHREARTLAEAGYAVKIIVPCAKSETVDGIELIAIPVPLTKFEKIWYSSLRTLRQALRQSKSAVFHVHDHKLLVVGYILKILGRKVVYDGHEDLPLHISYQHWIPILVKPFYRLFFSMLEWMSGWFFDGIIVSEPLIARHFPRGRATPIQTYPLRSDFERYVKKFERKAITYVGRLSVPRGLYNIVEALDILGQESDFDFHFAGTTSPPSMLSLLETKGYFKYHGFLSVQETYTLLMASHVAIYLPEKVKRYEINHPVKLFEYFAAGLPLVTYDFGYTGKLVNELQAGITVSYGDNHAVARSLARILNNSTEREKMADSARRQVFDRFNWENEAAKLLTFYRRLYA